MKKQPKSTSPTFESKLFVPENNLPSKSGGLRTYTKFKQSLVNKPLVSVITVVFNGEAYLEKTIQSVLNQTYSNLEYIIIDGGSTDKTLDIIKQYDHQLDYWVSEQDKGIYDAMNKGLTLVAGDIVGIINADDWYELNAIEKSVTALLESNADYTIGNCKKVPSNIIAKPIWPLIKNMFYQEMMYPHISALIKLDVYKAVGLFNTDYKIVADYEMATRINHQNFTPVYIDELIATIVEGGVSADTRAIKERLDVALKFGKHHLYAKIRYLKDMGKYYLQQIIPKPLLKQYKKLKKSRFQYE